ncbi:MAG TPA: sensor domain-containing diguanylate cyclase [Noviherbaspirillum sp.]|nr:sensor domain-containing diguanylate cyclase [Noviherbaspirillum sp.]
MNDELAASVELEKYRRIFHAVPDYASFSNLHTGVFLDVNPGFEKMTGYRRGEVIGRQASSINLWVHAAHRAMLVERLPREQALSMETQFRNRAGRILDVEGSFAIFEMENESLLVAVVRDITERKQAAQELAAYRTRLEEQVAQRTSELERAMHRLAELATHDELTGVGNRRDLNARLEKEYKTFKRLGAPCAVAVLDLDNFKAINDQYGHSFGDEVIKIFADILKRALRDVDYVARYGGDEFVLILIGSTPHTAAAAIGRMQQAVQDYGWARHMAGLRVTSSCGIAGFRHDESAEDAFRRADRALYKAKLEGRNRYVVDEV